MDGFPELLQFLRTNPNFQRHVLESPELEDEPADPEEMVEELTELNKKFVDTCVQNLRDVGPASSLAPAAVDYLRYTVEVLGQAGFEDGEPTSFFIELGTVLRELIYDYYTMYFKLEQQSRGYQVRPSGSARGPLAIMGSANSSMEFDTSSSSSSLANSVPVNGLPETRTNPLDALKAIGAQKLQNFNSKDSLVPSLGLFQKKLFEPTPGASNSILPPVTSNGKLFGCDTSTTASTGPGTTASGFTPFPPTTTSVYSNPGFFDPPSIPANSNIGSANLLSNKPYSGLPSSKNKTLNSSSSPSVLANKPYSGPSRINTNKTAPAYFSGFGGNCNSSSPVVPEKSSDVFGGNLTDACGEMKTSNSLSPPGFSFSLPTSPPQVTGTKKSPSAPSLGQQKGFTSASDTKRGTFTLVDKTTDKSPTSSPGRFNPFTTTVSGSDATGRGDLFTAPPVSTTTDQSPPHAASIRPKSNDTLGGHAASWKLINEMKERKEQETKDISTKGNSSSVTTTPSFTAPPVTSNGSIFGGTSGFQVPSFSTPTSGLFTNPFGGSGSNNIFSGGSSSILSGGSNTPAAGTGPTKSAEDEENEAKEKEAQSHEYTPVVEESALFSIKSKIFEWVANKNNYAVRGLGMLHILKLDEGHQLIVRADNALGNVLLNMKLDPQIPIVLEKNNLKTVDPHKSPPQRILIRVRTEADANELLEKINQLLDKS